MSEIKQAIAALNTGEDFFTEFFNNSGGALAHGDVVVNDPVNVHGKYGTISTVQFTHHIMGVVYDPAGSGVADQATGILRIRGFQNTNHGLAKYTHVGTFFVHSTTVKTCQSITSSTSLTTYPGAYIGRNTEVKTSTTVTTLPMFVDVK